MKLTTSIKKISACVFILTVVGLSGMSCNKAQTTDMPIAGIPIPKADMPTLIAATGFTAQSSASAIYVTVIKDGSVPVKGSVNLKDGKIDLTDPTKPSGEVTIDLTTFDSGLPLRNDRVKEYLFRTQTGMDTAVFKLTNIPADAVTMLRAQKRADGIAITGDFTLNGVTHPLNASVNLALTSEGTLTVKSVEPALVDIGLWQMSDNLKSLITICQHLGVASTVAVDFDFAFTP